VVLHKDSPRQEAWNRLKETNPILRSLASLRQSFDESESPVISAVRSATYTVASWFDENETAQVMRAMKTMDPSFTREAFERELREYIVPEVVDAYLSADQEALKEWCGEAVRALLALHEVGMTDPFPVRFRRTMFSGRRWSRTSARA
jgi:mitochondrial import inner membrane translocase subunit TIM44